MPFFFGPPLGTTRSDARNPLLPAPGRWPDLSDPVFASMSCAVAADWRISINAVSAVTACDFEPESGNRFVQIDRLGKEMQTAAWPWIFH
jgi:hypothetical protein